MFFVCFWTFLDIMGGFLEALGHFFYVFKRFERSWDFLNLFLDVLGNFGTFWDVSGCFWTFLYISRFLKTFWDVSRRFVRLWDVLYVCIFVLL